VSHTYHLVHYRTFQSPLNPKKTLEELCREALGRVHGGLPLWKRPDDRIYRVVEDGKAERRFLMNRVADLTSGMFGEVCASNASDLQALLRSTAKTKRLTPSAETSYYDLDEATAPSGTQFIRGLAYWLAIGDHLFFITLQSYTAKQLIEYLVWLINSSSPPGSPPVNGGCFQIELDKSVIGAENIGSIRKFKIGGNTPLGVSVPSDAKPKTRVYTRKSEKTHASHDKAYEIVKAALGIANAERLVDGLGPQEYITAEAEIKVRGTRTDTTVQNVKAVANEIADLTDAHVEVEGSSGKIKDGDAILRTKMPFSTPNEGGTLLDFDNVSDQMQTVYKRFVDDKKIVA
jgi:hypothetical protein